MNKGVALPIVLAVVLAVSIMLAGLLQLPFVKSRYALKNAQYVVETYRAESALIAYLAGFPQGYFEDLPHIIEFNNGPWLVLRAGDVLAIAGKEREREKWPQYADWVYGADSYRQMLTSKIQYRAVHLSGNRRFFKLEPCMRNIIESGDLTIDASGNSQVMSFFGDGSIVVKGNFFVDSLYLFAKGPISIGGSIRAKFVDIYSEESIRISGDVNVSGHIWGRQGVHLTDKVIATFPSVILAMGSPLSNVSLESKSKVEGVLAAPNGRIEVEPSAAWDSTNALLPFYMRGNYVAFEERLLK